MRLRFFLASVWLIAGCSTPSIDNSAETLLLAPAVDADREILSVETPNLLSGYTRRPVSGPDDWRRLNDLQSPAQR